MKLEIECFNLSCLTCLYLQRYNRPIHKILSYVKPYQQQQMDPTYPCKTYTCTHGKATLDYK